jgi:hypothetical protein
MSTLIAPSATITLASLHPVPQSAPAPRSSLGLAPSAPTLTPTSIRLQATWLPVVTKENGLGHLQMRWEVTSQH